MKKNMDDIQKTARLTKGRGKARAQKEKEKQTLHGKKRSGLKGSGKSNDPEGSRSSSAARKRPMTPGDIFRRETRPKQLYRLFFIPLVILWFELVLRIFCGTGLFRDFFSAVLFSVSIGSILTGLTSLFVKKVNRILIITILFIIAFWFVTEAVLYDSYGVFMTFGSMRTGAAGVTGNYGGNLLRAVLFGVPKYIIFCVPVILYIIFGKKYISSRRRKPYYAGTILAAAIIFHLLALFGVRLEGEWNKYKGNFNFSTATSSFGLMTGTRLNVKYAVTGGDTVSSFITEEPADQPESGEDGSISESDLPAGTEVSGENVMDIDFLALESGDSDIQALNDYAASQVPGAKNQYTGLFAGKNLIMICAEAFSDSVIDENLTPTLYRLVHNGFFFSEYYQPTWGGSTSTGEYSMVTGLAPLDEVETIQETVGKNLYFTMGNQMQRLGYYSAAYHDGEYDYYNRDKTHMNLGYDTFLGLGNGLEDITGNWPGDDVMFDRTMDTYIDKQPFSIYYMSISGHCTYVESDEKVSRYYDRVSEYYGDKYKDTTLYYICYQMELEDALTTMIEKLEAAGIADDTVICMTADHYPYGLEESDTFGNSEDYVSDLYGYEYTNSWEQDHNTCIIWSGCLENEYKDMACEVTGPAYSLDILPTLSNLFGVEYDSRLLPGRDVFDEGSDPLALWVNYSWATEQGKYDGATNTYYPNEGYTEDQAYIEKINTIVSNKIRYSALALDTDYWGYLFGEDPETGNGSRPAGASGINSEG